MEQNICLYRRQFVFGPKPVYCNQNWHNIKVGNNYLSFCSKLPIIEGKSINGEKFFILGIAIQTDSERKEPIDEATEYFNEIEKRYDSWAGRWIFLSQRELHMDFSGLLGCFYCKINGSIWISSSVSILLNIIEGKSFDCNETNSIKPPVSVSVNPLIHSLLPSQVLMVSTGEIRARQLFPKEIFPESEDEAFEVIENSLITGMQRLPKKKNVWVALSAGYDSRLLLAAALKANISVKSYTIRKSNRWSSLIKPNIRTSLVSKADMTLPPLIAQKVGIEHKWIERNKFSYEKLCVFDTHTYKQMVENDRIYYASGQWDWATDNDLFLLGQVLETCTCYYYNLFNKSGKMPPKELILNEFGYKKGTVEEKKITEYIDWVNEYQKCYDEKIDWRDRFYLEHRLAGWASSLQQGMDLIKGERIHLYNTQRIICAGLSLPKEKRVQKSFIVELIDRMVPELNEIPYNPKDPFFYNLKKILLKLLCSSTRDNFKRAKRVMKRNFLRKW